MDMDENLIKDKEFWSTRMDLDIVDYLDRIRNVFKERDHYKKLSEQLEKENEMLRHNITNCVGAILREDIVFGQ